MNISIVMIGYYLRIAYKGVIMKILVTGATGLLGSSLCQKLSLNNIEFEGVSSADFDIRDRVATQKYVLNSKPNVIIHLAAYTQVDLAEIESQECYDINVCGTENMVLAARELDAYFVFISTDYVFDGSKKGLYLTTDACNPINIYGKTKYLAEEIIKKTYNNYCIVRTSWLYGENGNSFVDTIIKKSYLEKEIEVVDDQFGAPTYTDDLANIVLEIVKKHIIGIIHATNEGRGSWADVAEYILKRINSPCVIKRVGSEKYKTKAKRPKNSSLDMSVLHAYGIKRLPNWEDAIKRYLNQIERNCGLMKKKVLVTGASGYLGRHVVSAFCDVGMDVIAVSRNPRNIDSRAEIVSRDIFLNYENAFKELGSPDICVHLAWRDGFIHHSRAHIEDLSKHYMFLNSLIDAGLKHLVVLGTMHEVGYFEGPIKAETPCNPVSLYGIAKDSLRRSMFESTKDKAICLQWLRAYYIYGDDKYNNSIFSKLIAAAEKGEKTFPFTSGKNLYDFIDVDELARQIVAVSLQTAEVGIINCCSGKPVSLAEKVCEFIKERNLDIRLEYGAYPDREYDSPGVWGDNEIIKKILNDGIK